MCHFITLIVPTDNVDAVHALMEPHGRAAEPIDNTSIRKTLLEGECQYLTTCAHCDCGTVLVPPRETPEVFEEKLAKEIGRMKRKGWSTAKIARAVQDRRKAEARPGSSGPDSFELWNVVLRDLQEKLGLPYACLFVRYYSGAVDTEAFSASRRQVPKNVDWYDALASLESDEVTVFSFN